MQVPVEAAVEAWASAWFTGPRPRLGRWSGEAFRMEGAWRAMGSSIAVNCADRARQRLARWALDGHGEDDLATARDRELLLEVADQALQDLILRIEAALQGVGSEADVFDNFEAALAAGGAVSVELTHPTGPVLTLGIAAAAFGALSRAAAAPLAGALGSRTLALGDQPLRLRAVMGAVRLSLAELEGLSIGDVLILDRRADEPADLSLPSGVSVTRGLVTAAEGHIALRVVAEPE